MDIVINVVSVAFLHRNVRIAEKRDCGGLALLGQRRWPACGR